MKTKIIHVFAFFSALTYVNMANAEEIVFNSSRLEFASGSHSYELKNNTTSDAQFKGNGSENITIVNLTTVSACKYDIAGGFKFDVGVDGGVAIQDDISTEFRLGRSIVTEGNTDFIVNNSSGGTTIFNFNSGAVRLWTYKDQYKKSDLVVETDLVINLNSTFTLEFNRSTYNDNASIIVRNSSLTFNGGEYLQQMNTLSKISNGKLIMNNKFAVDGRMEFSGNSEFSVGQTSNITGELAVSDTLNLAMADNITLEIATLSGNGNLNIIGYVVDTILVQNFNDYSGTIKLYGENIGDFLGFGEISGGAIALVNVPEPAEWAAILSAIALGVAMYRRKK